MTDHVLSDRHWNVILAIVNHESNSVRKRVSSYSSIIFSNQPDGKAATIRSGPGLKLGLESGEWVITNCEEVEFQLGKENNINVGH